MTETEWLACSKHELLVNFIRGKMSPRTLKRRQRLFMCACCRTVWPLITDSRSRNGIEVAEEFADGTATTVELHSAELSAKAVIDETAKQDSPSASGAWAAMRTCAPNSKLTLGTDQVVSSVAHLRTSVALGGDFRPNIADAWKRRRLFERARLADLMRDVFGNPFRPVTVDLAWLTPKVKTLAQAIYNDRAFERLPELADALAEAGCTNPDILGHCRGPGPHVRGCWVVDLVLGKE